MWQNNAFSNNGQFPQQNFNQDDLSAAPTLPSPFTSGPNPNFFQPSNMMQYEDMNADTFNGFQSDIPMYNQAGFGQNQFINPNPTFSPSQFNATTNNSATPSTPRVTQINARAAELRDKLLKQKREGRANSATPPVSGLGKQTAVIEPTSSSRQSPKTPDMAASSERERREKEINDLISDYSESKPTPDTNMKEHTNSSGVNTSTTQMPIAPGRLQEPSSGSPTKVAKPHNNGTTGGSSTPATKYPSRHASHASMSEGEIFDEPATKKLPPTEPKANQVNTKPTNVNDKSRKPGDDQIIRAVDIRTQNEEPGPLTRRPAPAPAQVPRMELKPESKSESRPEPRQEPKAESKPEARSEPPRYRDDRREENDSRSDKRPHAEHKYERTERKPHHDYDRKYIGRKGSRDHTDDLRRPDSRHDQVAREDNKPLREAKPPTLAQLLPHDTDLKDWLEITRYHDLTHRSKILLKRRELDALEVQKARILQDLQSEDGGGLLFGMRSLTPASFMQPSVVAPKAEPSENLSDSLRDRMTSNKRTYSEVQDAQDEGSYGKVPRIEDREPRRPKEGESDYRRRPSPSTYDNRNGDRESHQHDEGRHRGRSRTRDRELSPGLGIRAYEGRPPPRDRSFDTSSVERRPYEVRGGYRGKAYDPNYSHRGRGRGRGRGNWDGHESRSEAGFGPRNALGKPYKDTKGFDRGGKGDTRYFIVKSFNEENVIKCIEDGIWTTQSQNGPIFKEAFETCKNVILIFSINKSRAFQGYARMESLPGEIEVPSWQKAINWESAGAFKVKWLVVCSTRFHRVGHLKNELNEGQAVLIGKDGQEIEENCGKSLVGCIDEEVDAALESEGWAEERGNVVWGDE